MQFSKATTLYHLSDMATEVRSAKRESAVIFRCLEQKVSEAAQDVAQAIRRLDDQIANITGEMLQEEGDHYEGGDHSSSYSSSQPSSFPPNSSLSGLSGDHSSSYSSSQPSSFPPNSSLSGLSQSSFRSMNDNEGIYISPETCIQ